MKRRDLLAAGVAGLGPGAPPAARAAGAAVALGNATPRVALVVGNGSYAQVPLRNAVNDAQAVGRVLAGLGFEVDTLTDASRSAMEAGIARAAATLRGRGGIGLFYFAGHGMQVDWRNYLLPVDARIEGAEDLLRHGLDVERVLDAFKAAPTRMNIVVLDACRDNPFAAAGPSGRGLAQMDAPAGSFLAYATAPGNVAEDGTASSGNGPYAQFLVQELQRGEARIEDVFKRVRFAVRRHTQGRQVPWESTSLDEDFSFARGIVEAARLDERERDAAYTRELGDWQRVSASSTPEDLYGHLQRYPNGLFAELARLRLEQIQRAAVRPVARPGSVAPLEVGRRQYELGDVVVWELHDQLEGTRQRVRRRVTAIDGDRVIFNQGGFVLTQGDAKVRDWAGEKSPPVVEVVADMAVGRRWRSAFTNTKDGVAYRNYYESRVVALEDLVTPMGTVKTFRVEHRGESVAPDGRVQILSRTSWVDATRGRVMRNDAEFRWAPNDRGVPGRVVARGSHTIVGEEPARR